MRRAFKQLILVAFCALILASSVRAQSYFIRGDVDCNGVVDSLDLTALIGHVNFGLPISCLAAANVDTTGGADVDINDVNYLIAFFGGTGFPPPAPYPDCGVDPNGAVCEEACFCEAGANEVVITTVKLGAAKEDESYEYILSAAGGTAPYTWSLQGGILPPGLSLTSDGIINGTPTVTGSYAVTIRVTDEAAHFDDKDFILDVLIVDPPAPLTLTKWGTSTTVPGRTLDWIILIENKGYEATPDTSIVEYLEPWLTFTQAQPAPGLIETEPDPFPIDTAGTSPEYDAQLYWDVPSLDPGEWMLIFYSAKLDPSYPLGDTVTGKICWEQPIFNQDEKQHCDNLYYACTASNTCVDDAGCEFGCLTSPCIDCDSCVTELVKQCELERQQCYVDNGVTFCIPPPCDESCYSDKKSAIAPVDPNEKVVTAPKYIQQEQLLVYDIHFENVGEAEAQDVYIVDTLDPNLDISTLDIVSADGASFDSVSRELRWDLLGINLMPDSSDHVTYAIRPLSDLASGTTIENAAAIQFEVFDIFETNQTSNTIDYGAPEGLMDALPAQSDSDQVYLSWSGTDLDGEVADFTILYSDDGGSFGPLTGWTHDTAMVFAGEVGHTYSFICIARDVAGNIETQEPSAETSIEIIPPTNCCGAYTSGQTGNCDCDTEGKRNLADITTLIDHVYLTKAPLCCPANGNVDGSADGKITLSDITKLIDHVYLTKAETAACE